jgi:signal transduction histidine kinase
MVIPRPRTRSDWLEWAIAAAVLVTAVAEASGKVRGSHWNGPPAVVLVFIAVSVLPLATLRAHPVGSLAIAVPAFSLYALAFGLPASTAGVFVVILLAFGAGRYRGPRERWAVGGLAGLFVVFQLRPGSPAFSDSSTLADVLFILGIMAIPFAGGRVVANRQRLADQLRAQQPLVARAAVAGERARVARELHDVVAHSVSVMVIQSVAARTLLRRDPDRAEEALHAVEATGQEALAELRRLLGVLRTTGDPDEDGGLQPQPGLADLDALVAGAQRSGVTVDVQVSGERARLAAGVDLAAYRIVQEALTNVIRHAGTDRASVHVVHEPRALVIEVVDDGRGDGARAPDHGGGHGLAGMRERAALYGGALHAGPRDAGGYGVRADLPLEGTAG